MFAKPSAYRSRASLNSPKENNTIVWHDRGGDVKSRATNMSNKINGAGWTGLDAARMTSVHRY